MNDRYESKIIELTTLTPLFIKGKDLDYGEGMLRGKDGTVYLIDNDKLCEYIAEKNKVDEYAEYFSQQDNSDRRSFSIDDFLKKEKIEPNQTEIQELAYGVTYLSQGKKFVQNGNGKHFIPGSSIKGAIRNAILWKIISLKTPQEDVLDEYRKSLKGIAIATEALKLADNKQWNDAQKKFEEVLNADFLEKEKLSECKADGRINFFQKKGAIGKASLVNTLKLFTQSWDKHLITKTVVRPRSEIQKNRTRWQSTDDILRDILRIVKISDANLTGHVTLKKKWLNVICKNSDNLVYKKFNYRKNYADYQPIKVDLEILPIASQASFKVTIDKEMAEEFFGDLVKTDYSFLYSISDLLDVVNDFFLSIWEEERRFFSNGTDAIASITSETNEQKIINVTQIHNLYNRQPVSKNEKLFRTGWGGGYLSKTQFLHIDNVSRTTIRNLRHDRGNQVASKSRLLIVEGRQATYPLGWCQLSILGDSQAHEFPSIDAATTVTNLITQQTKTNSLHSNKNKDNAKEINSTLKQAIKQNQSNNTTIYYKGKKVDAEVVKSVPLKEITIKIGEQILTLSYKKIKQVGETLENVEILEVGDGVIKKVKLL